MSEKYKICILISVFFVMCYLIPLFFSYTNFAQREDEAGISSSQCDEIKYGDFGPILCGYNINVICKEDRPFGERSEEEKYICKKYFKLVVNTNKE